MVFTGRSFVTPWSQKGKKGGRKVPRYLDRRALSYFTYKSIFVASHYNRGRSMVFDTLNRRVRPRD